MKYTKKFISTIVCVIFIFEQYTFAQKTVIYNPLDTQKMKLFLAETHVTNKSVPLKELLVSINKTISPQQLPDQLEKDLELLQKLSPELNLPKVSVNQIKSASGQELLQLHFFQEKEKIAMILTFTNQLPVWGILQGSIEGKLVKISLTEEMISGGFSALAKEILAQVPSLRVEGESQLGKGRHIKKLSPVQLLSAEHINQLNNEEKKLYFGALQKLVASAEDVQIARYSLGHNENKAQRIPADEGAFVDIPSFNNERVPAEERKLEENKNPNEEENSELVNNKDKMKSSQILFPVNNSMPIFEPFFYSAIIPKAWGGEASDKSKSDIMPDGYEMKPSIGKKCIVAGWVGVWKKGSSNESFWCKIQDMDKNLAYEKKDGQIDKSQLFCNPEIFAKNREKPLVLKGNKNGRGYEFPLDSTNICVQKAGVDKFTPYENREITDKDAFDQRNQVLKEKLEETQKYCRQIQNNTKLANQNQIKACEHYLQRVTDILNLTCKDLQTADVSGRFPGLICDKTSPAPAPQQAQAPVQSQSAGTVIKAQSSSGINFLDGDIWKVMKQLFPYLLAGAVGVGFFIFAGKMLRKQKPINVQPVNSLVPFPEGIRSRNNEK